MKKFLITTFILFLGLSSFAKSKGDFSIQLDAPQNTIAKNLGKPYIITHDSDNILSWIYINPKKFDNPNIIKSELPEKLKNGTILTIKFDDNYKVISYSYMTTYIGEKND